MFALTLVWGGALIDFMSTNAEIRAAARDNLVFAALTAFTGIVPFVFDGVTQGATLNRAIRNGMLVSAGAFMLAVVVLQPAFGLIGLWAAMHIFFISRGAYLALAVRRRMPELFPA